MNLKSKSSRTVNKGFTQHHFLDAKNGAGFTLIEIVVATTIFAIVSAALMSLFNYTLKINRKTEALRQASQGIRSFAENLAKEIRNGQVDYAVVNGIVSPNVDICPASGLELGASYTGTDIYNVPDTRLGIINSEGQQLCFYLEPGGTDLMINKNGISQPEKLNPPNYKILALRFYIKPLADAYSGVLPQIQPFVTIVMNVETKLSTGETVPIFYQTSISTNKYDVPH